MARLPRDSFDLRAPASHIDAAALEGVPPLRFGATEDTQDAEGAGSYRTPRPTRLHAARGALLLALLCVALIALAWLAWTPVFDAVAEGAATLSSREGDGQSQLTATILLGAVAALGFVVAWWRATHPRRPVRLSGDRGRMAVDAIAGQLRDLVLELEEVRDAEVRVENRGRSRLRVRAWLRVSPEARIDDVLDGVDDAADWLVHHRLGLLLAEPPLADVKYDELDLRTTRASSPTRTRSHPDDEDA